MYMYVANANDIYVTSRRMTRSNINYCHRNVKSKLSTNSLHCQAKCNISSKSPLDLPSTFGKIFGRVSSNLDLDATRNNLSPISAHVK